MSLIDDLINRWVDVIDGPLSINKKQGFVLKNGMRIILEDSSLSHKSKERLSNHYKKEGSK
tara:strand:- start:272 stop:454 length:183 start_codon:yes stop_codon:yes gene_type:complete